MNRFDGFYTGKKSKISPIQNDPSKEADKTLLKDAIKSDFQPDKSSNIMSQQKQQKQQQVESQQQPSQQNKNETQVGTDQQQKRDGQQRQQEHESGKNTSQQTDQVKSSQQQQQTWPTAAEIKANWQKNVGAAKVLWGKLTDNEILQSEGHADKLSGLVKERYAISQQEADRQVKKFMSECNCK